MGYTDPKGCTCGAQVFGVDHCLLLVLVCACLLALLVVIKLVVSYMEMCTLLYYLLPRQIQVDDCLSKAHL